MNNEEIREAKLRRRARRNGLRLSDEELAEIGPVVIDAARRLIEEHGIPTKIVARLLKAIVSGGLEERVGAHLRFLYFFVRVLEKHISAKLRTERQKARRDAGAATAHQRGSRKDRSAA